MESMHKLVELEQINCATIPTIELVRVAGIAHDRDLRKALTELRAQRRLIRFGTSCIIKIAPSG